MKPFVNRAVARTFSAYPSVVRRKLLTLQALIFKTAASTEGVGEIEETLKWDEPAYLTSQSRSGSTIRIGWKRSNPSRYAIYFHCRTNLIKMFRTRFPNEFTFKGNRAMLFDVADMVPADALSRCIVARG